MKFFITLLISLLLFTGCSNLSSEQAYKKGTEFAKTGNTKKAYKLFKVAIAKDPENSTYHAAAGSVAPDQNAAFLHFKNAWEKGLRSKSILFTLLKLSFHVDKNEKLTYGLSLYDQLPDSLKTDLFKGELYFQFGILDSAIVLWKKQQSLTPSAEICNNISIAYTNKREIDSALANLLECKQSGLVNSSTFIQLASLYSLKFDYASVDNLFKEIENSVYYTSVIKLEQAAYLLIHDRIDESYAIIAKAQQTATDDLNDQVENRVRFMRAYIAVMKNQPLTIDTLLTQITEATPNGVNETSLLNALKAVINNDSSSINLLETARSKNAYNPFCEIIYARLSAIHNNYDKALASYTSLPGILQWSPRIVTEIAMTLVHAGKDDDAMKRVSLLHKYGIYSKQSLEIFRDIAFKKNLIDKSIAAQQLLEKKFGDDANVRWNGLLIALKENKIDTAQSIINSLLEKSPHDERFLIAKFSILLMKKDYTRIINELPNSGLPLEKIKSLEATALLNSGDTVKAISTLESGIQKSHDFQMMSQLAELYLNSSKPEKSATIYKQLIDQFDSDPIDSVKNASILNNYAWVLSVSASGDLQAAENSAKKALELTPDNLQIIDTYASILLKNKKFKECIKLIESSQKAKSQPRLLCYLAEAFEKTGDLNKARRYYEDAIKMDAPPQLPFVKSKDEIRQHIQDLLSQGS